MWETMITNLNQRPMSDQINYEYLLTFCVWEKLTADLNKRLINN